MKQRLSMKQQAILIDKDIEILFRMLYRPLCLYALHYLGSPEQSEDAVQDAFLAYWNRTFNAGAADSPKAYLYRAVRNICIDRLRKKSPDNVALDSIPADTEAVIPDEEAAARSEAEAKLWAAVDRLPEQRRKILLMSKRDGMKYSEIASELGISVFTVRNQLSRALASLRSGTGLPVRTILLMLC